MVLSLSIGMELGPRIGAQQGPLLCRSQVMSARTDRAGRGCSAGRARVVERDRGAVGARWFRRADGMPPSHLAPSAKPWSGRNLTYAEREEIAILRAQRHGVREIARRLERAPATISRELRRNAATRSGGLAYRAMTAQWHADRSARRPKPAKLASNAALRCSVPGSTPWPSVERRWRSTDACRSTLVFVSTSAIRTAPGNAARTTAPVLPERNGLECTQRG